MEKIKNRPGATIQSIELVEFNGIAQPPSSVPQNYFKNDAVAAVQNTRDHLLSPFEKLKIWFATTFNMHSTTLEQYHQVIDTIKLIGLKCLASDQSLSSFAETVSFQNKIITITFNKDVSGNINLTISTSRTSENKSVNTSESPHNLSLERVRVSTLIRELRLSAEGGNNTTNSSNILANSRKILAALNKNLKPQDIINFSNDRTKNDKSYWEKRQIFLLHTCELNDEQFPDNLLSIIAPLTLNNNIKAEEFNNLISAIVALVKDARIPTENLSIEKNGDKYILNVTNDKKIFQKLTDYSKQMSELMLEKQATATNNNEVNRFEKFFTMSAANKNSAMKCILNTTINKSTELAEKNMNENSSDRYNRNDFSVQLHILFNDKSYIISSKFIGHLMDLLDKNNLKLDTSINPDQLLIDLFTDPKSTINQLGLSSNIMHEIISQPIFQLYNNLSAEQQQTVRRFLFWTWNSNDSLLNIHHEKLIECELYNKIFVPAFTFSIQYPFGDLNLRPNTIKADLQIEFTKNDKTLITSQNIPMHSQFKDLSTMEFELNSNNVLYKTSLDFMLYMIMTDEIYIRNFEVAIQIEKSLKLLEPKLDDNNEERLHKNLINLTMDVFQEWSKSKNSEEGYLEFNMFAFSYLKTFEEQLEQKHEGIKILWNRSFQEEHDPQKYNLSWFTDETLHRIITLDRKLSQSTT